MGIIAPDKHQLKLDVLVSKADMPSWSLDADIDWLQGLQQDRTVYSRRLVFILSQLMQGERITRGLCEHMLADIDDPKASVLLRRQIDDEQRHEQAYCRYLNHLGDTCPANAGLLHLQDQALAWRGSPLALIVAVQIILESEALDVLQSLIDGTSCDLLQRLNTLISRDEASHVAFGSYFLREQLAFLSLEERLEIYFWLERLWTEAVEAFVGEIAALRLIPQSMRKAWSKSRWRRYRSAIVATGLLSAEELALVQGRAS